MSMRNNKNSTQKMTIAESLRLTIQQEMERDKKVFCIGEDIGIKGGFGGAFTVTLGLSEQFGHERILDTPISETGIAGVAIGAALSGMRPIADVQYSDFLFCAMDQLVNQAAKLRFMSGGKLKVPMVMRAPGGATTRGSQHSQSLESYFLHVPGLKVACPSTAYDAKGLFKSAIRDNDPVLIMESEKMYGDKGEIPDGEYLIPIGKADIKRKGDHVTLVTFGKILKVVLEAAEALDKEGVSCEIVDLRSIRPIDYDTVVNSVKKTNRCVVIEESWPLASISGEIAYHLQRHAFDYLDAPVMRVMQSDTPFAFSKVLIEEALPSVKRIIDSVKSCLYVS